MQRRIIAIIIVFILFVPFVVTASADSSGLCFTATNDNLLELSYMTAFVGGTTYIPAKVFSTYGVYYSYFESKTTAELNNGTKQIFFDLSSGNSYDSFNETYSVSAVFKNGQVYVPVAWVCNYFGLGYSYINGNGYGDIVRLKNGKEVLSDSKFLEAATNLMRNRYNEYFGNVEPVTPVPTQTPTDDTEIGKASVSLCFIGLPSEKMLDSFDNYAFKACFFITAEEAAKAPDTIRRMCGSGHSIGIYCGISPDNEVQAAEEIIFEAAQVRPTLITSPAIISQSCLLYADANGYAYFSPAIEIPANTKNSANIISKLEAVKGYTSLSITVTADTENYLPYLLQFITTKHITLLPLLEASI